MVKHKLAVYISSIAVAILIVMALDFLLLYRKKKNQVIRSFKDHQLEIDELMRKHEAESVNAVLHGRNSERKRVAQELHDHLGSLLFTAKLHYNQMAKAKKTTFDKDDQNDDKISSILDEAVTEVRRISHDLYGSSVSKYGFETAIEQLCDAVKATNAVAIKVDDCAIKKHLDDVKLLDIYRICQELLSNTLKHANATVISLEMFNEGEKFHLRYTDNGVGFNVMSSDKGLGIKSIQDRCLRLGAIYRINTAPSQGMYFELSLENEKGQS